MVDLFSPTTSDAAEMSALWGLMTEEVGGYPEYRADWWQDSLELRIKAGVSAAVIARDEHGIVGMVVGVPSAEAAVGAPVLYGDSLYVVPQLRDGKLVSRMLRQWMLDAEKTFGCKSVYWPVKVGYDIGTRLLSGFDPQVTVFSRSIKDAIGDLDIGGQE